MMRGFWIFVAMPLLALTVLGTTAQVHSAAAPIATLQDVPPAVVVDQPAPSPTGIMTWLGIIWGVMNALNGLLPWPDKEKRPKLYLARALLDALTMLRHGTLSVPGKVVGPGGGK